MASFFKFTLLLYFLIVDTQALMTEKIDDFVSPEQITNYIVERFSINGKLRHASWTEKTDQELKTLFKRHFLGNTDDTDSSEYKNEVIDKMKSSTVINSEVTIKSLNKTISVDSGLTTKGDIIYNVVRGDNEEKVCMVYNVTSQFNNTLPQVKYSVNERYFYGGGVDVQKMKADRIEASSLGVDEDEDLSNIQILRAVGKSSLKKEVHSEHFSEDVSKHNTVTAIVVVFNRMNCDNNVGENVDCNQLARVYHHINSKLTYSRTYKGKKIAYDADSYGTIITVVKRPKT